MGTILEKLQRVLNTKGSIRQAIVSMGQAVAETDPFASYADKIRAIRTGVETGDATAVAGDILSGKTAYVKGQKVTGTIPSVEHPAPTQSLDTSSNSGYAYIKASHTQKSGHVTGGTTTHNYQVTRRSGGTQTPGASQVQLAPAGLSYFNNALYMGASPLKVATIEIKTTNDWPYLIFMKETATDVFNGLMGLNATWVTKSVLNGVLVISIANTGVDNILTTGLEHLESYNWNRGTIVDYLHIYKISSQSCTITMKS